MGEEHELIKRKADPVLSRRGKNALTNKSGFFDDGFYMSSLYHAACEIKITYPDRFIADVCAD